MQDQLDSPGNGAAKEDTISLLDLISVLVKRRWFIIITTAAVGAVTLLYAAYSRSAPADARFNNHPNRYTPVVTVRLQESDSSSFASALQDSSLGLLAGLSGGSAGGPTNADLAMALLSGNALLDAVAEQFNFIERYDITQFPKTKTRAMLRGATETEYNPTTGIMAIRYTDISPEFATEVLNALLDGLEARFKELTMEGVQSKRDFLALRLSEVEEDLKTAQQALITFQRKHGIFDLNLQTQKQIEEISSLNSSITKLELDIMSLLEYRKEDDPQVLRIRKEIDRNKLLLEAKQSGFGEFSVKSIPQDQMPEVQATYLDLRRDLTILDSIYLMLREQYETVKIEEKDNSRMFQVVERAEVPERKSEPSRAKLVIIVTMATFFLAVFTGFIMEYFDRIKRDPEESQKLEDIKNMLRSKKRRL